MASAGMCLPSCILGMAHFSSLHCHHELHVLLEYSVLQVFVDMAFFPKALEFSCKLITLTVERF
jgi:hypothetical protein